MVWAPFFVRPRQNDFREIKNEEPWALSHAHASYLLPYTFYLLPCALYFRIKDQRSRIMDLVLARMSILEEIRT